METQQTENNENCYGNFELYSNKVFPRGSKFIFAGIKFLIKQFFPSFYLFVENWEIIVGEIGREGILEVIGSKLFCETCENFMVEALAL